ncbi:helix-turn-helix domain-containing protein [Thiocystis violacea]|uniref:helix-turn-helix domain-containing protein n=1 Tax=Thiocystis violacea TaxID=13725 RepID=UPI0019087257|nr:type II toxin-antitoxin system MqsA family antitoxin [Thiocystis violacea]MBK1719530.1 XRE family transcriptional regulator [Thiocystis violacea]
MNIDRIANAIEQDAGETLPGLRESLAEMHDGIAARITTPEQMLVRSARQALGLSQPRFADLIQTPVATLRDWEQGRFVPPGAVLCLLRIVAKHPEVLTELAA